MYVQAAMNFEVEQELIEVPAITLSQPKLFFRERLATADKKQEEFKIPKLGKWNLKHGKLARTPNALRPLHKLALPKCFGNLIGDLDEVYEK